MALVGDSIMIVGGDIVVKANQQDVKNNDELMRYLVGKKPGETVILRIFRDGKFEEVELTLGERPPQGPCAPHSAVHGDVTFSQE